MQLASSASPDNVQLTIHIFDRNIITAAPRNANVSASRVDCVNKEDFQQMNPGRIQNEPGNNLNQFWLGSHT